MLIWEERPKGEGVNRSRCRGGLWSGGGEVCRWRWLGPGRGRGREEDVAVATVFGAWSKGLRLFLEMVENARVPHGGGSIDVVALTMWLVAREAIVEGFMLWML